MTDLTEREMIVAGATLDKLRQVSTATLTTQLIQSGFRATFLPGLTATRPDLRMAGFAYTLRYVPAREDMDQSLDYDNDSNVQRLAVESIGQDDVLVIDARADVRAASFGHIIATRILRRGAAGLVTDGALRDFPAFATLALPSYCRGSHATTSAMIHHAVDMNVPIACCGVLVMPGDVIVGDAEGVVVIPLAHAREVAESGLEQELLERFLTAKVSDGASIRGVYPPNEATLREYNAWRTQHGQNGA